MFLLIPVLCLPGSFASVSRIHSQLGKICVIPYLLRHASILLVTRLACLHTLFEKGLALPLKREGNKGNEQGRREKLQMNGVTDLQRKQARKPKRKDLKFNLLYKVG